MALTEAEIEAMKVPYGRNQYKVSDGGGLYLLVKSSGRYWKLAYRFDGKQKSLALGVHPTVSLEEARQGRDEAKALLAQEIDPGELRKQEKQKQREAEVPEEQSHAPAEQRQPIQQHPVALERAEEELLEARRLATLQILATTHGYATDESTLQQALASHDHHISRDRLRTDLAWLYEQQAVKLKTGALWGIYLTQFGFDAAEGRMWIPGIKRPEATTPETPTEQ